MAQTPLASFIADQIDQLLLIREVFEDESDLRYALGAKLGDCLPSQDDPKERSMVMAAPQHGPLPVPAGFLPRCKSYWQKENGWDFPPEGYDPLDPEQGKRIGKKRIVKPRLDLLWHSPDGPVAIEVKYCSHGDSSDIYGYRFLFDLHRLERLHTVDGVAPVARFAAFVSHEAHWWSARRDEVSHPTVQHGMSIRSPAWTQYTQDSPVTNWGANGYPPFYLANDYDLHWSLPKQGRRSRFLLQEVGRQGG